MDKILLKAWDFTEKDDLKCFKYGPSSLQVCTKFTYPTFTMYGSPTKDLAKSDFLFFSKEYSLNHQKRMMQPISAQLIYLSSKI